MASDKVERIQPDPKMVHLIDCAIDEVNGRISGRDGFSVWHEWAAEWKAGRHSPAACVEASHACSRAGWEPLGQIAWAAKEACYSTATSPWLVIRYVADAMFAFGVKYPDSARLLEPHVAEPDPLSVNSSPPPR